jgi:hypothetical protein
MVDVDVAVAVAVAVDGDLAWGLAWDLAVEKGAGAFGQA